MGELLHLVQPSPLLAVPNVTASPSMASVPTYDRFYELGLTRDSRVIPGLTVASVVLSTSNLGLNWD